MIACLERTVMTGNTTKWLREGTKPNLKQLRAGLPYWATPDHTVSRRLPFFRLEVNSATINRGFSHVNSEGKIAIWNRQEPNYLTGAHSTNYHKWLHWHKVRDSQATWGRLTTTNHPDEDCTAGSSKDCQTSAL